MPPATALITATKLAAAAAPTGCSACVTCWRRASSRRRCARRTPPLPHLPRRSAGPHRSTGPVGAPAGASFCVPPATARVTASQLAAAAAPTGCSACVTCWRRASSRRRCARRTPPLPHRPRRSAGRRELFTCHPQQRSLPPQSSRRPPLLQGVRRASHAGVERQADDVARAAPRHSRTGPVGAPAPIGAPAL